MLKVLKADGGQSLVELAISLPILLLLVLGVIEVGRYAQLAILVSDAARAGALYGSQNLVTAVNTSGIQTAAQNDANLGPGGTGLTVQSWSGLLPLSAGSLPSGLSSCGTMVSSGTPVTYVVVQTTYIAQSLFSSRQFTFNSCAQVQVAE